jgi:hypothetical protein
VRRRASLSLALFLLLTCGPAAAAERVEESDSNADGRADTWVYYDGAVKRRREVDRNFDGRAEQWYYYDEKGRLFRQAYDKNGDGRQDAWRFLEQGQKVVLFETDKNGDGSVDERSLKVRETDRRTGALVYRPLWREQDTDFDGKTDRFWQRGNLVEPLPDLTGHSLDPTPKEAQPSPPSSDGRTRMEQRAVERKQALWDKIQEGNEP